MESLCPGCMQFTTTLVKDFLKVDPNQTLATINFIPYGNAKESGSPSKYIYTCQHGEKECLGNLIESCAIKLFNYLDANNFIICLEENDRGDFNKTAENCLKNNDKFLDLQKCTQTSIGNNYQHEMAANTDSLKPPHKWVPWVTVSGEYDDNITSASNLVDYLCTKRSVQDRSQIQLCNQSELKYMEEYFLAERLICKRN